MLIAMPFVALVTDSQIGIRARKSMLDTKTHSEHSKPIIAFQIKSRLRGKVCIATCFDVLIVNARAALVITVLPQVRSLEIYKRANVPNFFWLKVVTFIIGVRRKPS